ncbi:16S rRNA (cytosine(967)-C(5))-methyltransferase RsmB [Pseudoflavonifractor sp. 60]|uniref:16S rRNA (cytosine(967)-C(5))-methyltransferase RsmB n=1 Tax=Pseudoflavonifractor sp. 60 TaxID=2304576 RepID=UPI0013685913|nr:16S rRNA (cytosine(967)-C(5))-methyltransferase RsmB [Pseudoflavonifractor sp. 60]NBI66908.1 16S rRNA (cytosine(967)-C(5))-methyltransferase RsmB [Pseudoflavonifractor sp. 60]
MDAREAALLALNDCQRQGGWSDAILKKQLAAAKLDSRDGALATQLCFGVLQNQLLLDFYLSHFSNLPLKRMEGRVVQALRLGAYQMLFLDKIPHSAAVNASVELTRKHCKNSRAPGMVNGILRNLERSADNLPSIPRGDPVRYLSTLYSHPEWLVGEFLTVLGSEEAAKLLAANNSRAPITAMVNTTRTTARALTAALEGEGVQVEPHPWLDDCLTLSKTGNLERLEAFQQGEFYIQDPASKLAALALEPQPGMKVLDCCAAPGGKSFSCAIQMEGRGEVTSCDLHPHKKKLIQAGAGRLGLTNIFPMTADGKVFRPQWENAFDRVLVDAPCSGLGVIRKKPDIRYKDPAPLAGLPQVQQAILDVAARYVKPKGLLVYSTCTLLRRENEEVVQAFLKDHPAYKAEAFTLPGPVGAVHRGMATLWPHRQGTDGFFISKLRKEE